MQLSELENKRVAIWGYGREGRAALAALRWRLPRAPLALLCSESEAAEAMALQDPALYVFTEEVTPDLLARFQIVIKSPGISPYLPPAAEAAQRGVQFVSGTALWFGEHREASTICVTGTKGKSTTSALIAHLLRAAGARTALAGNIGMPLLELLDVDPDPEAWVIELSSFQTREAVAPEVAVVLNLFPEHLDWHGGEERYIADKLALVTRANPRHVVLNAADARLAAFGRSASLQAVASEHVAQFGEVPPGARLRWFNSREGWHTRGSLLYRGDDAIMDCATLPLPGAHNRGNLCAALAAIEALGIEAVPLAPHAATFRPLPHRRVGAPGRTLVVEAVRRAVGVRFREAMHGAGVIDELPVGADRGHFLLEADDLLVRHVGIVGAVEHQQRRLDRTGFGGRAGRIEPAVERDRARELGAAARQFQRGGAAEAEANYRYLAGVDRAGRRLQHVDRLGGARAQPRQVAIGRLGGGAGFLRVLRAHVGAEHVGHQHDVVAARDVLRARHGGFVHAHPVRHHHDARLLGAGIVVDQEAAELGAVEFPFDGRGLHGGVGVAGGEREGGEYECTHGGSP